MAVTSYSEPGPYLSMIQRPKAKSIVYPNMAVVVIGSGIQSFNKTVTISKSATTTDALPFTTKIDSLVSVKSLSTGVEYVIPTDVTLSDDGTGLKWVISPAPANSVEQTINIYKSAGSLDDLPTGLFSSVTYIGTAATGSTLVAGTDYNITNGQIEWLGTAKQPAQGAYLYIKGSTTNNIQVTAVVEADDSQYTPQTFLYGEDDKITSFYGGIFKSTGVINPISLGLSLVLSGGAPQVIGLQVKKANANGSATSFDYQNALASQLQYVDSAYWIIPLDNTTEILSVIESHVALMSTEDERGERKVVSTIANTATSYEELLQQVGGYASATNNSRVNICYPNTVSMTLSDDKEYDLSGNYLLCAFMGARSASTKLSIPMTGQSISLFTELKGIPMKRTQKNKLAGCGVMLFEQPAGIGTPIECRHQLTTNMSSIDERESSIQECADYCAKELRNSSAAFCKKNTISPDNIASFRLTMGAATEDLVKSGYASKIDILNIYQDKNNADSVILEVDWYAVYPWNYVKIRMYV